MNTAPRIIILNHDNQLSIVSDIDIEVTCLDTYIDCLDNEDIVIVNGKRYFPYNPELTVKSEFVDNLMDQAVVNPKHPDNLGGI